MAMEDAVAIRADAKGNSNPSRSIIAGIRIIPRAATVAGPEPDTAPKKQATMTETIAIPPLRWPIQASAKSISLVEIPAFAMMLPDSTKNGMDSNRNLAMPE